MKYILGEKELVIIIAYYYYYHYYYHYYYYHYYYYNCQNCQYNHVVHGNCISLIQVFLQFAKAQLEADEDEDNAVKARQKSRHLLQKQPSVASAGEQYRTHL